MNSQAIRLAFLAVGFAATPVLAASDDDAPSYTIEDVTACSKDAMRLCRDKLADISAIETCMKEHFSELRPKCQARFKK